MVAAGDGQGSLFGSVEEATPSGPAPGGPTVVDPGGRPARLRPPGEDRPPPTHHPAPDTELTAAGMVRPRAGTLRGDALEAFRKAGAEGLTDQELSGRTGEWLYTIAPRRVELVRDGWVEDSGQRRLGIRARPAIVWRLTQAGRAELEGAS